jgi:hypothetical protein
MLPNKRQDAKWRLIDFTTNRANAENLSNNYVLYSNSMIKNIFLRPNVIKAEQTTTKSNGSSSVLPSSSSNSTNAASSTLPSKHKPILLNHLGGGGINNTDANSSTSNKIIDRVMSKRDDLNTLNKYVVEKIIESTKAKEAFLEAVIEKKLSERINLYGVRSKSAKVELSVDNFKNYIHKVNVDRNKTREHFANSNNNSSYQPSPRSNSSGNYADKYSMGVGRLNLRIDESKASTPRKSARRSVSLKS